MSPEDEVLKVVLKLKPKRILLIEDDPDDVALFVKFSGDFNCDIDVAQNGDDAIRLARTNKYALILLDYKLANTDGATIFEKMEVLKNQLRVSIFSGHIDTAIISRMNKLGCFTFIVKPVMFSKEYMTNLLLIYGFSFKGEVVVFP